MPVWQGLRTVESADLQLTPDQAAQLAAGSTAKRIDSPDRIHGRGVPPHWALLSLHNPAMSQQSRVLAVESTTQFDMRLFARDGHGQWRRLNSVADAAAGRIGGGSIYPVWEFQLAPQQTTDLLLRIEGPAIVRFPVFVYHPMSLAERAQKLHVVIGIALGSCLFIGIYIVSLRRYIDDRSVPLYLCMLLADLVGALWLSGFLSEMFPAVSERALSQVGFSGYAALFGCGCLHARIYMATASWVARGDRLLQVLGWFWLALAPWFSLAFPVAARVLIVWGGSTIAAILVIISILAARQKIPFSKFIAAAWLTYLLVGLAFLLARIVDNPLFWSSSGLTLVQATGVAILFGFAMSQRLLRQRDLLVAAHQEDLMDRQRGATIMRERSLLFAATNHDLRQPLFGVSLFADLLKSANSAEEKEGYARKLHMALKEVDDHLVSIQQLAAVYESSHQTFPEVAKLDDLLAPLIEEYRGRAEYKRLTIRYVPSRLSIKTHLPYFQRIVRNILTNAIRYTDQGDRVLVGCRRGGGLRLVIADTGRGMSEAQTRRAFEAFQRFDTDISFGEGSGLGLFSTRSLANALGLVVGLRSREGHGTEFSLSLREFPSRPAL